MRITLSNYSLLTYFAIFAGMVGYIYWFCVGNQLTLSLLIVMGAAVCSGAVPFLKEIQRRPTSKRIRETREHIRRGERFEVTRDTLTVWQEGEKQVIPWSDIIGYDEPVFTETFNLKDTVRIRTIGGKEFSFTPLMDGAERFAEMLPLLARNAVAYRRGKNEQAALGGMELRWTGGEEGKGDRIFHRRTRTNLYDLLLTWGSPTFMVAWFLLFGISIPIRLQFFPGIIILVACLAVFFNSSRVAIKRTRSYLYDRVILGKEAIQVIQFGKEKVFRWDAVSYWSSDTNRVTLYDKDGTLLEFNPSEYAYGNELPDLIRESIERAKAEVEQAVVLAADVTQPAGETAARSNEILPERQQVRIER